MVDAFREENPEVLQTDRPGVACVVLHTRPRCEKRVAVHCRQSGVPCYLPLYTRTHRYGGRVREFSSPLFPGYVFAVADPQGRMMLSQNRYVANMLKVIDEDVLHGQLKQIHRALQGGDVLEVMPYLQEGRRVQVRHGPLRGLEGLVVRMKGSTRVVVNVDMISQSVAVEVDQDALGPA